MESNKKHGKKGLKEATCIHSLLEKWVAFFYVKSKKILS